MKITHLKGTNYVTYEPKGRFISKIRSILKLVHLRIDSDFNISKVRSKKKYQTFLSALIKQRPIDVLFIYKFGEKPTYTYVNKQGKKVTRQNKIKYINHKGFTKYRQGYQYTSEWFSKNSIDKKITAENLIKTASIILINNWFAFQVSFSDESEPWPLQSITFKFILHEKAI